MTANNTTYGQKLSDGVVGMIKVVAACVAVVFCWILGKAAWGTKKISEGVEYVAEQGKDWSARKAAANAYQAGSDLKESYDLYRQQPANEQNANLPNDKDIETEMKPVNKVEDEGYYSEEGEKLTA